LDFCTRLAQSESETVRIAFPEYAKSMSPITEKYTRGARPALFTVVAFGELKFFIAG